MEQQFKLLFEALASKNPSEADDKVQHITNYFLEDLDTNAKDLYIVTVFNTSTGILKFINDCAKDNKFTKAVTSSLELVYTLINNFPISVIGYLPEIIKSCRFLSHVAHARSKQKAFETLDQIITSKEIDVQQNDLLDIYVILDGKLECDSDSAASKAMTVLGNLIKHYPNIVPDDKMQSLLKHFSQNLHIYVSNDTNLLIEGSINLISNLLHHGTLEEADEIVLYKSLKNCCRYKKRHSQTAYRAALYLFSEHIRLFSRYLLIDVKDWENYLHEWLIEGENFKAGSKALDAFHSEVSKLLKSCDNSNLPLLTHFIDKFQTTLNSEDVPSNKVRIAVRGLGYFASACRFHFTSSNVYNLFISILQKVEHLYILCPADDLRNLDNLPDYVYTLSSYIAELDEIDSFHIASLQKVAILMVRLFPKLSESHHGLAVEALIINMHCIERSNVSLQIFLRDLIEQCVIWTCSHASAQEVDSLPIDNIDICTYKSYLPLWSGVLKLSNNKRLLEIYPSTQHWQLLLKMFFSALMDALLVLVNRLNLDVKSRDDCIISTDPNLTLEAVKMKDYVMLVNIADFYVAVLEIVTGDLFSKWILPFSHHILTKSLRHPLVSGFYKLLAANLVLCDRLNYFSDARLMQEDVNLCFQSFVKLVQNILPNIRQSKDDLQIACMSVVLSAPIKIIEAVDADFTSVFVAVFSVGRTVLHIADKGVDTIERWHKFLPQEKMQPLLKSTLPILDSYLRTHTVFTQKEYNASVTSAAKKNFRKRKVTVEAAPELQRLQRKILKILSQMNSELCWEFVNANAQITINSWSNGENFKLSLQDDDIDLCLDKLMPRILELAEFCSDKKVRFMACELLHSTTMIMIGNSTQREMSIDVMLEKMVRVILVLAADNNMTIRELFSRLITQMMHWYSSSKQRSSGDTQIILNILLNEISNPNDVKIRDLVGRCLKEFVAWTIKQSSAKSLKNNLGNIDVIIDKLKYFSNHPDSSKRLGAALIYNNIYYEFKQEDLLLNTYWLDLLHSFITNLSMTQNYNEDKDCIKQVKMALDHLCKGLIERQRTFNTAASEDIRKTPTKFTGNQLSDVAAYLLENTTSLNTHCRHKCLEMYVKVTPVMHGCSEAEMAVQHKELFFKSYEHLISTHESIESCKGIEEIFKWFHSFNCLLDGHIFLIQRKFLPITVINESRLFKLLEYFIASVLNKSIMEIVQMSRDHEFVAITTQIREEYSCIRRLLIEKIISFTIALLNNKTVLTEVYFNNNLWGLLTKYVLNIHALGYLNINFSEWTCKTSELINLLTHVLPTNLSDQFVMHLFDYILSNIQKTKRPEDATTQSSRQLLRGIILLQATELKEKIDFNSFRQDMIKSVFKDLLEIKDDVYFVRTLTTVSHDCYSLKIQFATENLEEFLQLVFFLCHTREVKNIETHEVQLFCMYIYTAFEATIVKIVTRPEYFTLFIENALGSLQVKYLQMLLSQILKYISKNLKVFNAVARNVVDVLCGFWGRFQALFQYEVPLIVMGINLIERLAYVDRVDCAEVLDWILLLFEFQADHLSKEEHFHFINQRVFVLGLVAKSGQDLRISSALSSMKNNYSYMFTRTSNISGNSLMIKVFFEAAQYSKSIDILSIALNLHVSTKNEFVSDLNSIMKTYVNEMPHELQLESLHVVHTMCKLDTFDYMQRIKLTANLSCLLQNCDYSAFENFYLDVIGDMFTTISSTDSGEELYVSKIVTCLLIESLFLKIDTSRFDDKDCPITESVFPGQVKTGRELLQKFTRILAGICKESAADGLEELFRLYQCYAYNALVSMVCNTQKERVEPYTLLFHREDAKKKDILWSKIIDNGKVFDFNVQVNEIYSRKKVLVKIRTEIKQSNATPQVSNYLDSQNLFMSTLSEDVCRFDFNNVVVRTQSLQEHTELVNITDSLLIELSNEPIDQHECMASVCGAIKHMAEMNFIPTESAASPSFINCMRNVLLRDSTVRNVKLFLAKVIENTAVHLKDHGKWLMGPIIKIIIDGFAGNTINSFVSDIMVMFLTSWSEVEINFEDKQYITKLIRFLMENVHSEIAEILKYNLKLLQLAVEKWKGYFDVPYNLIAESLQISVASKKLGVTVHVINILLANGLVPWENTMKTFVINFCNVLASEHKQVYQPCAETIGLALKHVSESELIQSKLSSFKALVLKVLASITDADKFANCLEAMSKHYPEICVEFHSRIIYNVSSKHVQQKSVHLRILIRCCDIVCQPENMAKLDLPTLIKEPKIEALALSLELVNKCVNTLTVSELEPLVTTVCTILDNKSAVCRATMYDILISVWQKFCQSEDKLCKKIVGLAKDVLLQGLTETDSEIEQKITNFWITNEQLPLDIGDKILYLLENMYKASIEELYLPFSMYLLLGTLHTDIEANIFKKPLAECAFRNLELPSHWKSQQSSMVPMFASTLCSQDGEFNMLRATQPAQQSASQNPLATQRASFVDGGSSLLIGSAFKDPNDYSISTKYQIFKRRFNKDQGVTRKFHAQRMVKAKSKELIIRKESVKKQESNIQVYRSYRDGDLPDIEIQLSSVIKPLQGLAKHDAKIARLLFVNMFGCATHKSPKFIKNAREGMNNIFNSSTNYTPTLMAALMDVAIQHKDAVQFEPQIVNTVCQNSGLMSMGATLLEEYLISGLSDGSGPSKRVKGVNEDNETKHWGKLADLYKSMDDWDVVRAIFLEKMMCSELTLEAIEAESDGMWKAARDKYKTVIMEDVDEDRRDFYYESIFKCFAEMSSWDELSKHIESIIPAGDVWDNLWSDQWNKQKLLPYYLTSQIRIAIDNPDVKVSLTGTVNAQLRDSMRCIYLKDNHSDKLAFLSVMQEDFVHSNSFLDIWVQDFLENWSYMDPLFPLLRLKNIISMRNTIDVHMFIREYDLLTLKDPISVVRNITTSWERSAEDKQVPLVQSEIRHIYRQEFSKLIIAKLQNQGDGSWHVTEASNLLNNSMFNLNMILIDSAINSGNYHVAKKYLACKRPASDDTKSEMIKRLNHNLLYSKFCYLTGTMCDNPAKQYEQMVKSLQRIETCMKSEYLREEPGLLLTVTLHLFQLSNRMHCLSGNNEAIEVPTIVLNNREVLAHNDIIRYGEESLTQALRHCDQPCTNKSSALLTHMGNCFYKLAHYMMSKGKDYTDGFIRSTFKGMFYGSPEARLLFPCMLSLDELASNHREQFIEESSNVPVWMFLRWIPQLLSYLDSDKSQTISHLVMQIAMQYPNSLVYAYKISKGRYAIEDTENGNFTKEICYKLDTLLENPLIDTMLEALTSVSTPFVIIKTIVENLKKSCAISADAFNIESNKAIEQLFGENFDYFSPESTRGQAFKCIDKCKNNLKKIIEGKYDKKRMAASLANFWNGQETEKKTYETREKRQTDLGHYSPWLKYFSSKDWDKEIEIPGQYKGDSRPLTQYHIKLSGFSSTVKIFHSLRKPIRITMLGSDTKEYMFLIKYGEDLRQDQRIEQMFKLMNNVLYSDPSCCQRKLDLVTYEVIPLTNNLGIIEWVVETETLIQLILKGCSKTKQIQIDKIRDNYDSWINKAGSSKSTSLIQIYCDAAMKFSKLDTTVFYRSLVNKVPWDALRISFKDICVDAESLFAFRERFIRSYATMCISHWLLGIGDRHLENILVSLSDGRVVGIDFGCAFGTATQELGVPELVPFRLTPQIVNVTLPHNVHGPLQESMIHTLRALRKSKEILLSTLDVFVREPTLNWLNFVDSVNKSSNYSNWYPVQRLTAARRKFDGDNPCTVMMEEVRNRKNDSEKISLKYLEYVKGNEQENFRARKGGDLAAEEQVKCLIDQATDYNLLGRMFAGWQSWI